MSATAPTCSPEPGHEIARIVDSKNKHRNVETRLSRNLQTEGLAKKIQDAVMDDAKRFVDKNTLIIYDPTEVCKPLPTFKKS